MEFRKTCDITVKVVVVMLCLGLFIFNSFENAMQYYTGKTMVTTEMETPYELSLPSFTFCNSSGFKSLNNFYDKSQYLENTIKASDIFMDPIPPLKSTYSRYLGHCFTFTVRLEYNNNRKH
jgi:hypothetical protein